MIDESENVGFEFQKRTLSFYVRNEREREKEKSLTSNMVM
jgi:hypothetical protein